MGNRRPEARGREVGAPAGVVEDADDPGRPLVARGGEAELLDELLIAGRARDGRRARVRHVGEERSERDDELHVELPCELHDLVAKGAPPEVGLDAEHEHGIAVGSRNGSVVEDRVGPVDPARDPVLERDVRTRGLEVVELLGVDVREAPRLPRLGEEARRERGALRAVVPAPKSPHEHGAAKGRAPLDAEMATDATESTAVPAAI